VIQFPGSGFTFDIGSGSNIVSATSLFMLPVEDWVTAVGKANRPYATLEEVSSYFGNYGPPAAVGGRRQLLIRKRVLVTDLEFQWVLCGSCV
jgi:hypothetical protein